MHTDCIKTTTDCSHRQACGVLVDRLAPCPYTILRFWDQGCRPEHLNCRPSTPLGTLAAGFCLSAGRDQQFSQGELLAATPAFQGKKVHLCNRDGCASAQCEDDPSPREEEESSGLNPQQFHFSDILRLPQPPFCHVLLVATRHVLFLFGMARPTPGALQDALRIHSACSSMRFCMNIQGLLVLKLAQQIIYFVILPFRNDMEEAQTTPVGAGHETPVCLLSSDHIMHIEDTSLLW